MMDYFNYVFSQSATYTDLLIEAFKPYCDMGVNPNFIIDKVFAEVGCTEDDLTEEDKLRLETEVAQYFFEKTKNF